MLFASERYYHLESCDFLNQERTAAVFLGGFLTGDKLSPLDGSAIDQNKQRAYLKAYSEHAERALLNIYQEYQQVQALQILTGEVVTCPSSDFSYQDEMYRKRNDTTGTGAGVASGQMIKKATCELLEKNELMLLWYAQCGRRLLLADQIKEQASKLGLNTDLLYIFVCQNLCNRPTVIVAVANDRRLLSSGIALSDDFDTSLQLALEEARLLQLANSLENPTAVLNQINEQTHQAVVNHLQHLNATLEVYQPVSAPPQGFTLASFITDLRVHLLNQGLGNRPATIKCVSNQLLNYLPRHHNMAISQDLLILEVYRITTEQWQTVADCMLL